MELNRKLICHFEKAAQETLIDALCVGTGYTAVATKNGGVGVSYTYADSFTRQVSQHNPDDFAGLPAMSLLRLLEDKNPHERSMAMALVNALNHGFAKDLPEDRKNQTMFELLEIEKKPRVAMVGFFGPMIPLFEQAGAKLDILDINRNIGEKKSFYKRLKSQTDSLILTSTSILNNTTEEILANAGSGVKTVMLGPTTPLVPEAFCHLSVHMLAGTVPMDGKNTFEAVRSGCGARPLMKWGKKVHIVL